MMIIRVLGITLRPSICVGRPSMCIRRPYILFLDCSELWFCLAFLKSPKLKGVHLDIMRGHTDDFEEVYVAMYNFSQTINPDDTLPSDHEERMRDPAYYARHMSLMRAQKALIILRETHRPEDGYKVAIEAAHKARKDIFTTAQEARTNWHKMRGHTRRTISQDLRPGVRSCYGSVNDERHGTAQYNTACAVYQDTQRAALEAFNRIIDPTIEDVQLAFDTIDYILRPTNARLEILCIVLTNNCKSRDQEGLAALYQLGARCGYCGRPH